MNDEHDEPLENSNADSLELDPEKVEAQFAETERALQTAFNARASLRADVDRVSARVDRLTAQPPAPELPPLLYHRLDEAAGPYIKVADCELEGASVYATRDAGDAGHKVYDALLTQIPPETPEPKRPGYTQAAVADLTSVLRDRAEAEKINAANDGYSRGFAAGRATQPGDRFALAAFSFLGGATLWVIGAQLVYPAASKLVQLIGGAL